MLNKKIYTVFLAFITVGMSGAVFSAQIEELKLAEIHGCTACHSTTPANAREVKKTALPVGPSFQEIARRFHANKDEGAYHELYRIVKHGSSPYRSKWQGKISGLAMPPNDETISDLDINRLLVWILTSFEGAKK